MNQRVVIAVVVLAALACGTVSGLQFPSSLHSHSSFQAVNDIGSSKSSLSKQESCEGKLTEMAKAYKDEEAARQKELAVIRSIRKVARDLGNVKDLQENKEEEAKSTTDVEEGRRHKEVHGKGGVLSILDKIEDKIVAESRSQKNELENQRQKCQEMCGNALEAAQATLDKRRRAQVKAKELYDSSVRAVANARGKLAAAKGAVVSATREQKRGSKKLERELALVKLLIKKVGQLGSGSTSDIDLSQDHMQLLEQSAKQIREFGSVLSELRAPKSDVRRLTKLLEALKDKILQEMKDLTARVEQANADVTSAENKLEKSKELRGSRHASLVDARKSRDAADRLFKSIQAQCRKFKSSADAQVDVQQDDSGDDEAAVLEGLLGALGNGKQSSESQLNKLLGALAGSSSEDLQQGQSGDDETAMLMSLLKSLGGSSKEAGESLSKRLASLSDEQEEGSSQDDVAEDESSTSDSDDAELAELMGLLGSLDGGKGNTKDMSKLLGSLAGGDSQYEDVDIDGADTPGDEEEFEVDDLTTDDSNNDLNAALEKVYEVARKTNNVKKIKHMIKKLEKKQ